MRLRAHPLHHILLLWPLLLLSHVLLLLILLLLLLLLIKGSTPHSHFRHCYLSSHNGLYCRNVHFVLEEKVCAVLNHDADVSLEVKGDLIIVVNDAKCGRIIAHLDKTALPLQFKVKMSFQKLHPFLTHSFDHRHIRILTKIGLQKKMH